MTEFTRPSGQAAVVRVGDALSSHRITASRCIVGAFVAALLATASMHEQRLLSAALLLLAFALVGVAVIGRAWCALYISGYKDARLVTDGPYSLCRNPLYFFSLLGMAGVGLASETLTLGVLLPALFVPEYRAVVRREEAVLRSRFGGAFDDYCAATPRFVPRLRALAEPGTYEVRPRVFRRALGDLVWFVWCLGIVQFVVALHEFGVVRPLLRLP